MSAKFRPKSSEVPYENWVLPDVSSQPHGAGLKSGVSAGKSTSSASAGQKIGNAGIAHTVKASTGAVASSVTVVDEDVVAEKVTLAELEKIHEQAHLEGYEAGREEGRKAGHAEGLEQGLAEGRAQAETAMIAQQEQLTAIIAALSAPLSVHHEHLSLLATELSLAVAEAVIPAAVLSDNFKAITQAVAEALALLPENIGRVRILVNPDEVDAVSSYVASLSDGEAEVSVVAKADIERGGCVIKSEHTDIDHLIKTRFDAVAGELRERIALALSHRPTKVDAVADDDGSE